MATTRAPGGAGFVAPESALRVSIACAIVFTVLGRHWFDDLSRVGMVVFQFVWLLAAVT